MPCGTRQFPTARSHTGCYSRRPLNPPRCLSTALSWRVPAIALVMCACLSAAQAQSGPIDFSASASVLHRKLVERTASGATLVREHGPMGRVGLRAVRQLDSGGALAAEGSLAGGDIEYDGQMQFTGLPLFSTTRHVEVEADLAWRPLAPAPWGEGWLTLGLLVNHRTIRSTALTRPLYERSSAAMAGLRWHSPVLANVAGWSLSVQADARKSVRHLVHVDFYGLFDPNELTLPGGRKQLLKLRLLASAEGSPWEWAAEWSRLSQGASGTVSAGGFVVSQPELSVRDASLRLTRRF